MSWPLAFFLGGFVGLAIASYLAHRGVTPLGDELRDVEFTSGWVRGYRAARRAARPGAKPVRIPPGVLQSMLEIRDDQEAGA